MLVLKDGVLFTSIAGHERHFVFEFDATEEGDYRLQLQRGTSIEALSNPITLRSK